MVPFLRASFVPGLALAQGTDAASPSDEGYLLIFGAGGAGELELAGAGHLGLSAFLEDRSHRQMAGDRDWRTSARD
jgi:hypothetical protein